MLAAAAEAPLEPLDVSLLYFMNAKKTGATLTIAVSRPGMKTMTKTLTMRPERRPRVVTKSGS